MPAASPVHFQAKVTASVKQTSPVYPAASGMGFISFSAQPAYVVFPKAGKTIKFYGTVTNGKRSQKISALTQDFSITGKIVLFEIDLTHIGLDVLRFTCSQDKNLGEVKWGGNSYIPFPIMSSGFEISSRGSSKRPALTFSAVLPEMTALVLINNGLQGAEVRRITTFARFLDNGEDPDPTSYLFKERYYINKISPFTAGKQGKMELVTPLDMENVKLPARTIYKNYCSFKYRYFSAEKNAFVYPKYGACPYAGERYFDEKNNAVAKEKDVCAKSLDACVLRFGKNSIIPYGGFPGVLTGY